MNKLNEELAQLKEKKILFESILKTINDKESFEKLNDYEQLNKVEDQVLEIIEQINSSINRKMLLQERIIKYKKIMSRISIPILISIILFQLFKAYDFSVILVFLFLLLLYVSYNSIINFKKIFLFSTLAISLFIAYIIYPPVKQIIQDYSSAFTFLSLIYAMGLTFFSKIQNE